MDDQIAPLLALVAGVIALAAGYAKAFGAYQCQIAEWVIDAGRVPGRLRGVVNLGVGVAIAAAFGGLGARQAGDPGIVALGLLAGVLASVEAAKVHDAIDKVVTAEEEHVIPNPNAPHVSPPELTPDARTKLTTMLDELITTWPATDETGVPIMHIAERELAHRLGKDAPPGVDPKTIDANTVREVLRGGPEGRAG